MVEPEKKQGWRRCVIARGRPCAGLGRLWCCLLCVTVYSWGRAWPRGGVRVLRPENASGGGWIAKELGS